MLGAPEELTLQTLSLKQRGYRVFYMQTGMIKRVCGFAGARAIAKSRTRVSEISSSSSEVPTIQDYVAYVTDCKEQAELQRQNEQEVM